MKINDGINILEQDKQKIVQSIIQLTNNYDYSKEMYKELEKLYNELYYICDNLTELKGSYQGYIITQLENELPCIFNIDAKPIYHDYDNEILKSAYKAKCFYTLEEAETLLKWTVNNTRNNINRNGIKENLTGSCGFCQFSSLYPLNKLGLKVTINNASSFCNDKIRHAFGTVIIPIKQNNEVINKQYLIDCSYSQFFILSKCVENNYSKDGRKPEAGYFIRNNKEFEELSKLIISNGFVEATEENLKKYAYGLYMSTIPKEQIQYRNNDLKDINISNIINNVTGDFDYDEEEFISWGCNLSIDNNLLKRKY